MPSCVGVDPARAEPEGMRVEVAEQACERTGPSAAADLRKRSPYGLVGMSGNVWEWVADWYADDAYAGGAATDPTGPAAGTLRVNRGGGWTSTDPLEFRVAARGRLDPGMALPDLGFRCVWTGTSSPEDR